jgi:hypothetical protein
MRPRPLTRIENTVRIEKDIFQTWIWDFHHSKSMIWISPSFFIDTDTNSNNTFLNYTPATIFNQNDDEAFKFCRLGVKNYPVSKVENWHRVRLGRRVPSNGHLRVTPKKGVPILRKNSRKKSTKYHSVNVCSSNLDEAYTSWRTHW